MKRIFSTLLLLLFATSLYAQSPEAIRESLSKYPNLAYPVASTYPSIPLGEIAAAPEGFEPFYFSLVGRHGSRYDHNENRFYKALSVFDKAAEMGILTDEGKAVRKRLTEIYNEQKGHGGELSRLGFEQWRDISRRAFERFGAIFTSGSIEAKSSTSLRCVLSMATFNETMKGLAPQSDIHQDARACDLWIVRPLANDPGVSKEAKKIHKEYHSKGEWKRARKSWDEEYDASAFISKVTTNREAFLEECGAKREFRIARYTYIALIFGENFEKGDREMLKRLFTTEELYGIYVYITASWVNNTLGRGNDVVEMRQSHMRSLVEDILDKGDQAIKGENPHVANLRFTHDSYVGPTLSVMGYEGCVAQHSEDLELAATSINHGALVPMAANLQIILYRNKRGEVLVRSLINERDATLPIKCATAPFYPWSDFCKYVRKNMDHLDKAQTRVLEKHSR